MANGLYVYAITSADARLPESLEDIHGLQGAALLTVVRRDLAAVASPVDRAEIQPTAEQVLAHEAVVEGIRRASPSLPVRFGTVLADTEALQRVLSKQHDTLAADLARIGDKVELGLSVLWEEPPTETAEEGAGPSPPAPTADRGAGTRYLLERLSAHRHQTALERRAGEVGREVGAVLDPRTLDRRSKLLPTARMPLRAAYLVNPAEVDAFRAAFEDLRRAHPELRFLLNGPWPPYSFVTPPDPQDGGERGQAPELAESDARRKHGEQVA